ncbi:sodium-dependent transporter [Actinomyces trachealis]|uniref:sodium-dependent transporter n=1 Tax=Actinomyces trachealis TaxID=2763540 RepID=UPI001892D0E2|nr:sodium-dependent transporter [Actinomyces trachealis]
MSSSSERSPIAEVEGPEREQWGSQLGFLLAAIGSAIGLGNIWRFPGVAYANGGGAFMIPYIVALLSAGIPILLLDYAVGHRYRGSAPAAFRRLSRKLEWLGWWQVFVSFVIMTYYAVIIAWSLRYVLYSTNVAWKNDADGAKNFFFNKFIHLSENVTYSPAPVWNVFVPLAIIWAIVIFVIARGVTDGVEKANKVFLPLLVVLFLILVLRALMLPGATDGLNALWTPNFSALKDPQVWISAYAQIFYSLSVAFGIMLTYASYLRRRSNLVGTGLVAAFANSSFEVLAGFGVFATLGFMAHQQGIAMGELQGLTGISLSFVTFPTVIAQMPGGAFFGILFFLSLTLAGVTSLISLVQVVAAGVGEKFNLQPRTASVAVGVPAAIISLLVFGTTTGIYSLDVVDAYINQIGVVSSAILMCFIISLALRKLPLLQRHLNTVSETGKAIGLWWRALAGYIVPAMLTYMFADTLYKFVTEQYDAKSYSRSFELAFGWGAIAFAVIGVVVMTLIPWKTPVDDFEPLDLDSAATSKEVK